jgi:hypothetical protein
VPDASGTVRVGRAVTRQHLVARHAGLDVGESAACHEQRGATIAAMVLKAFMGYS